MDNYEVMVTVSDQIIQDVLSRVASGEYKQGDKLPSVREMAAKWLASPDTVQRAYAQLEQIPLIETKRGLGTFINNNEDLINSFRTKYIFNKIDSFVNELRAVGMSIDTIISYLKTQYMKYDILFIETKEDAEVFLANFEKYADIDEMGRYSIKFHNEIDYLNEIVWTILYKSNDKWFFYSHGETWMPLKAKEMPKIVPFILKYSKAIIEAVSKKEGT